MPGARLSILFVVAAGILFNTAGTAQALGPATTSPIGVGVQRIQVCALALLVAMPFLGHDPRRLPGLWRSPAMLVSTVSAALYQPFFFAAVSETGVALGTLAPLSMIGVALVFAGLLLQGLVLARERPEIEEPAPIL